jgi:hypothetical protein
MSLARRFLVSSLLGAMLALVLAQPAVPVTAQTTQRCFAETGFCIEGRIREFWEQNGGLAVFGLPIGPQQQETIEGTQLQVQRFERNRLELHPENARPNDVLLGRLGADRLAQQNRDWNAFAKVGAAQAGCLFFAETGHSVCEPFLSAFRANGLEQDGRRGKSLAESVALFGLPLSEPQVETLSDGKNYTVQWFERARFESHPENQPPYNVLLGLLGNEIRTGGDAPAPQPAPAPAPAPAPGDSPLPASQNASAVPERGPIGTRFDFEARGFVPGERVGVYFTAPDRSVYGAPFQTETDANGVSEGVFLNTQGLTDLPTGVWAISFEGVQSGRKAVAYFQITAGAATNTSAAVSPASGKVGTEFEFSARGFVPGERIGIYVTMPNGDVLGARFQTVADGNGVSEPAYFPSSSISGLMPGRYAVTFEGTVSGRKAVAYFELQP